jgi:hypothetical protein
VYETVHDFENFPKSYPQDKIHEDFTVMVMVMVRVKVMAMVRAMVRVRAVFFGRRNAVFFPSAPKAQKKRRRAAARAARGVLGCYDK